MASQKINMEFLGALSTCLEQYIKGKIQPIEILKVVESSLPNEDKSNWNPRSEFKGHELIETFLEVKGMTQTELAKSVDLSPAKINDIIKGRRVISTKTAKMFAKVFGVEHTVFL
jgi:DNA-binding XRE family transcriptional regulator